MALRGEGMVSIGILRSHTGRTGSSGSHGPRRDATALGASGAGSQCGGRCGRAGAGRGVRAACLSSMLCMSPHRAESHGLPRLHGVSALGNMRTQGMGKAQRCPGR